MCIENNISVSNKTQSSNFHTNNVEEICFKILIVNLLVTSTSNTNMSIDYSFENFDSCVYSVSTWWNTVVSAIITTDIG